MKNLWQSVREYVPMAAVLLLCLVIVPTAQANTNNNGGNTTTTTQQATTQSSAGAAVTDNTDPVKGKQKVSTRPREKSILDSEVLESPMAYFRNAFSSEEDSADAAPSSGAVMTAVKALVATLLSTIM